MALFPSPSLCWDKLRLHTGHGTNTSPQGLKALHDYSGVILTRVSTSRQVKEGLFPSFLLVTFTFSSRPHGAGWREFDFRHPGEEQGPQAFCEGNMPEALVTGLRQVWSDAALHVCLVWTCGSGHV
jgi:hypothetical protein